MNNNESPLSIAEQIEVLEAAKKMLVVSLVGTSCMGLCGAINCVIYKDYNHLREVTARDGIHKIIPSFTFENAVIYGTNYGKAAPDWFWWDTSVEKGGITKRLNFLNFLIDKLKNEYHE